MGLGYFGFDNKDSNGAAQDTLWSDIGQAADKLEGKDWAALFATGLGAYGKSEELAYNKDLAAKNAAWQQKLLDTQLNSQAEATAYRDTINDNFSTGFDMAQKEKKKSLNMLGTVPVNPNSYVTPSVMA